MPQLQILIKKYVVTRLLWLASPSKRRLKEEAILPDKIPEIVTTNLTKMVDSDLDIWSVRGQKLLKSKCL